MDLDFKELADYARRTTADYGPCLEAKGYAYAIKNEAVEVTHSCYSDGSNKELLQHPLVLKTRTITATKPGCPAIAKSMICDPEPYPGADVTQILLEGILGELRQSCPEG